jgi:hypothetical protein
VKATRDSSVFSQETTPYFYLFCAGESTGKRILGRFIIPAARLAEKEAEKGLLSTTTGCLFTFRWIFHFFCSSSDRSLSRVSSVHAGGAHSRLAARVETNRRMQTSSLILFHQIGKRSYTQDAARTSISSRLLQTLRLGSLK